MQIGIGIGIDHILGVDTGNIAIPDTQAPTAPTGLAATAVSSSQIDLSWTAATDDVAVTGYNIFRDSTQIGTATGTTYSDTGLTASTTYTYTVKAHDATGNLSAASSSASATTDAAATSQSLSMNGTSDRLKTPAFVYDKIVVDAEWSPTAGTYHFYWADSTLTNGLQRTSGGLDHIVGNAGTAFLDGVAQTDNTGYVPVGTRCTLEVDYTVGVSNALTFCANGGGTSLFMAAILHDIKIYNGATLMCHYDMSTGSVVDQSGNGRDGTLTGGTWITG